MNIEDIIDEKAKQLAKSAEVSELVKKGWEHYCNGKKEDALGIYNLALIIGGDDKEIYRKMSMCYLNMQDFVSSIKMDKKALELDPDYIPAYVGLIVGYSCKGDATSMLNTFHELKQKSDNWQEHREALFYVSRTLYGLGRRDEAKKHLEMMKLDDWEPSSGYLINLKKSAEQILRSITTE